MTSSRKRHAVAWGLVGLFFSGAAFFACSSSSSSDDSNGVNPDGSTDGSLADVLDEAALAAENTACQSYWTAWCQKSGVCAGSPDTVAQTCIQEHTALCPQGLFGGSGANIQPSDYQTCTTAVAAQSCEDFRLGLPASPSCVVAGTHTQNEPCHSSAQCQSFDCAVFYGGCGVCTRLFDPTEDCTEITSSYVTCAPGTFCDRNGTRHCVPYTQMICDITKQYGGGCPGETACVTTDDASVGTCAEVPSPGSACLYSIPYKGDVAQAYCGAGYCAGAPDGGTCTFAANAQPGDACGALVDGGQANCVSGNCEAPIATGPTICAAAATGEACGAVPQNYPDGGAAGTFYDSYCATGNYCTTDCILTTDGGALGACNAGGSGTANLGAPCDSCNGCTTGLECVDNKCAPIDVSGCE